MLLSADNVLVCCWHAAIVLAFLQALWRAPARGQVRWDGDAACLEEAAHLFGFMIRGDASVSAEHEGCVWKS